MYIVYKKYNDNKPLDTYIACRQMHTECERLWGHGPIARPLCSRVYITHFRVEGMRDMAVYKELLRYLRENSWPDEHAVAYRITRAENFVKFDKKGTI